MVKPCPDIGIDKCIAKVGVLSRGWKTVVCNFWEKTTCNSGSRYLANLMVKLSKVIKERGMVLLTHVDENTHLTINIWLIIIKKTHSLCPSNNLVNLTSGFEP